VAGSDAAIHGIGERADAGAQVVEDARLAHDDSEVLRQIVRGKERLVPVDVVAGLRPPVAEDKLDLVFVERARQSEQRLALLVRGRIGHREFHGSSFQVGGATGQRTMAAAAAR
jgi:acetolactate synthase small subunit